jgi:MoxR-like ATPase
MIGGPCTRVEEVLPCKELLPFGGRYNVGFEDVRRVCLPALRHRLLLNFEAQAENIPADAVLAQVLHEVREKAADAAGAARA